MNEREDEQRLLAGLVALARRVKPSSDPAWSRPPAVRVRVATERITREVLRRAVSDR